MKRSRRATTGRWPVLVALSVLVLAACGSIPPGSSEPAVGSSVTPSSASPGVAHASPWPSPRPTPTASPTPSPAKVEAYVALDVPGAIGFERQATAVGFGSLWIAFAGSPHGWLVRFDPIHGRVTARIPVGESPGSVALAGGSVWVANDSADRSRYYRGQNTLSRIDPRTNRVVQTVHIGVGDTIAGGFGAVWVPSADSLFTNGTLRKIDARTGHLVAAYPIPGRPVIACDELWAVHGLVGVHMPEVLVITSIDPRSGQRTDEWPLITPDLRGPQLVDGQCTAVWASDDFETTTSYLGPVLPFGISPTGVSIAATVRIMDGELWAAYDDGTFQPMARDGTPAGKAIALPTDAIRDGGAFLVVHGRGWVVTNRAAFGIGKVRG